MSHDLFWNQDLILFFNLRLLNIRKILRNFSMKELDQADMEWQTCNEGNNYAVNAFNHSLIKCMATKSPSVKDTLPM